MKDLRNLIPAIGILLLLVAFNERNGSRSNSAPIPDKGLRVLIVEDVQRRDKLPRSQLDIVTGSTVRDWLTANAIEHRIVDDEADMEFDAATMRAMYQRPRVSVPWLCAGNGKRGIEKPLPMTAQETIQALEGLK